MIAVVSIARAAAAWPSTFRVVARLCPSVVFVIALIAVCCSDALVLATIADALFTVSPLFLESRQIRLVNASRNAGQSTSAM